jgi:putative endonuclease
MTGQGRREFGDSGEAIAARYVESLGWRILGRNVTIGKGELDITAMDGDDLVILEVRSRRVGKLMPAETSVGPMKLRTLIKTSRKYVQKISFDGCWRIDVIAITEDESGNIWIELFRDVTMGMSGPFMG